MGEGQWYYLPFTFRRGLQDPSSNQQLKTVKQPLITKIIDSNRTYKLQNFFSAALNKVFEITRNL